MDKVRTKIINLIGGHPLHLYNIQKSSVGVWSMSDQDNPKPHGQNPKTAAHRLFLHKLMTYQKIERKIC
ncbi:MAG: hypothetical protein ACI88A_003761 [Paraglaciecola sp.]